MGYFANGTEGQMYEEQYCERCIHGGWTCPIWTLHMMHNYEQHKEPKIALMLDTLIPRKGCFNEECKMFVERIMPK